MQALAPVVSNDWTILAVVGALVVWAGWSAFSLMRGTRTLIAALEAARARVERYEGARALAVDYEALSADLRARPLIGARWRAVAETLDLPTAPGRPVRSTVPFQHHFDLGLLRAAGVNARYDAALPNLLVGAGLLFTFLGLAVALTSAGGVVGGDPEARNAALRALLDAASAKFVTSVAGLSLSIAYALLRKARLAAVEAAIDRFVSSLDQRIPRLTLAALQVEANERLSEQVRLLGTFTTDLATTIGNALDGPLNNRLGEHIKPLTDAMQRLAAQTNDRNEGAIRELLDGFVTRLQGGAGDRMQDVAQNLVGLSDRLEGLQLGLGEASTRMAESADAVSRRMGEGAEEALGRLTSGMQDLAEALRGAVESARGAGTEAGRELVARIEEAGRGFETATRDVAGALTASAGEFGSRVGQEAEASAGRLAAKVEELVSELSALAASSRATGTQAFGDLADRLSGAAASFESTAARAADALERAADGAGGALGRGAGDAVERIAAASEEMRAGVAALSQELRGSGAGAGEALRAGGAAGAEAVRAALGEAGSASAREIERAAAALSSAAGDAGEALRRGGDAAGGRIEEAGAGFGGRAEALSRGAGLLADRVSALSDRMTDFERAAGAVVTPLGQAANDLRAAAEASRAGAEPLVRGAQETREAIDGVRAVAARLEAAGASAERLTERLTVAADRFAGVDDDLAKVLSELQSGLRGFREEVKNTVVQTDSNLAQAVGALGNFVRQLEETLEEAAGSAPGLLRAAGA